MNPSPNPSPIVLEPITLPEIHGIIQLYSDFHWQERYNTTEVPRSYNFTRLYSLDLICFRAISPNTKFPVGYFVFSIHPTHNPGVTTAYLELAYTLPKFRNLGIFNRAIASLSAVLSSPWEIIVGLAPGFLPPAEFSPYEMLYRKTSWQPTSSSLSPSENPSTPNV